MNALLEVSELVVAYGEAQALHSVSLEVRAGEIVSIVGANGAGKSTLLRTISGLVRPRSGAIRFDGREIAARPVHEIVALGLAHIPEGRGILGPMSVGDNLRIGGFVTGRPDPARLERVRRWFPVLFERLALPAGMLSGGEQQMLAIGRSVMSGPKLVMIDELSLGLAPKVTSALMPKLREMRDSGTSVLLVDQSLHLARKVSDRICLLANGRVVWSGPAADLGDDETLMSKYLGVD